MRSQFKQRKYGSTLQAASFGGHRHILRTLLENGADANFNGVKFGCALQAGSLCDHDNVVQLLLTNRADVNFQGDVRVAT